MLISAPVVEGLLDGESLLRAGGEHLPDEVLGVVADVLPAGAVQVQLPLAHSLVQPAPADSSWEHTTADW